MSLRAPVSRARGELPCRHSFAEGQARLTDIRVPGRDRSADGFALRRMRNAELDADWCSKSMSGRAVRRRSLVKIASFDDHLQKVRRILPGLRFQVGRVPPRRPSASSAALGTFAASHARTAAKRRAADA